ncbi:ABC transporter substrate-binding protein [Desulfobotulus mexicanus]|uniref:ABC transporter substrate-binding protein n=1 Tax=Desulfobotulus mexicanus TaxID=2586642 RepID=A0A5S5MCQ4_9BACT|nr:helical backbone metal receptor [Desulfobotulus mexicanus]TYT73506.1 ABC transporter substrate-binding protein [Desulfobotulus mexicanus]
MKKNAAFFGIFLLFFPFVLSAETRRILPMAPNLVEAVFALGAGDMVAAIPEYTSWPPEALDLPVVGGYFNPNLERIAAIRPDLVILQGRHEKMDTYCRRQGIPVLRVSMENRASITEGILVLGKALERENEAVKLVDSLEAELEKLRIRYERANPPAILLVLGTTPGTLSQIMTAGKDSYLTELIALAGGRNIFDDHPQRYPSISKEAILMRQPDIILELLPGESPPAPEDLVRKWRALGPLPAVRHGRIRVLSASHLQMAGPRIPEATALLGEVMEEMMLWEN